MKSIEKVFITIGILVIVIISGAVYVNSKVDKILEHPGRLGALLTAIDPVEIPMAPEEDPHTPGTGQENLSGGQVSVTPEKPQPSASDLVFDDNIEAMIQNRLDKPIERKDKIKVALILLKRLSTEDIIYFYDLITLGEYSDKDIRRAQNILTDKLNEDEIATLKSMTKKYGFTP